jgi:hypothetical protein
MKKIIKCFLLTTLVLLLNCCITNKIIYDKSTPSDQLCTLEIPDHMTVTGFNGEKVNWTRGFWWKTAIVQIPAGEHELTIDYFSQSQKGDLIYISSARNLKVKYNFKPEVNHKLHRAMIVNKIIIGIDEMELPSRKSVSLSLSDFMCK